MREGDNTMFKYRWTAEFEDASFITQPEDDRYSKHDDNAEWNPSSFRDIQEHDGILRYFSLFNKSQDTYTIDLYTGIFTVVKNGDCSTEMEFSLERPLEELSDRELIYFRTMRMNMQTGEQYIHAYNFGYKGKDKDGNVVEKVITVT